MNIIISEILEQCQNDMEYLQEIIDTLQQIVNNEIGNEIEEERELEENDTIR